MDSRQSERAPRWIEWAAVATVALGSVVLADAAHAIMRRLAGRGVSMSSADLVSVAVIAAPATYTALQLRPRAGYAFVLAIGALIGALTRVASGSIAQIAVLAVVGALAAAILALPIATARALRGAGRAMLGAALWHDGVFLGTLCLGAAPTLLVKEDVISNVVGAIGTVALFGAAAELDDRFARWIEAVRKGRVANWRMRADEGTCTLERLSRTAAAYRDAGSVLTRVPPAALERVGARARVGAIFGVVLVAITYPVAAQRFGDTAAATPPLPPPGWSYETIAGGDAAYSAEGLALTWDLDPQRPSCGFRRVAFDHQGNIVADRELFARLDPASPRVLAWAALDILVGCVADPRAHRANLPMPEDLRALASSPVIHDGTLTFFSAAVPKSPGLARLTRYDVDIATGAYERTIVARQDWPFVSETP